MLVLTALGWRLPLRAHMGLQALLVAMWIHLGVGPHSRSKVGTPPAGLAAVTATASCPLLPRPLLPYTAAPSSCFLLAPPPTPCQAQLVTSPEVAPAVSAVYGAGEFGVALLVPVAARPPGGEHRLAERLYNEAGLHGRRANE